MARGITRVAKRGENAKTTADKNLSFSSEWKTPKIFMQTSSNWTNTIGYVPNFMGFRQLNNSVPATFLSPYNSYYKNGGFNTGDYCHSLPSYMGDSIAWDGITLDENGNLLVSPFYDYYASTWEDENAFALLMLDPIDGSPPSTYDLGSGGLYILAKEGDAKTNFPTRNSVDSRFDTFKIAKTGTLVMNVPAETIIAGSGDSIYTEVVEHKLGYPPVYLPEAGIGMRLDLTESFIVNDILGLGNSYDSDPILDVYVNSDNLIMRYRRQDYIYMDTEYNALTITLYYTIFYNEIGEEFNLLNDTYK